MIDRGSGVGNRVVIGVRDRRKDSDSAERKACKRGYKNQIHE